MGFIQTEFEELIKNFHVAVLAKDNKESMIYSFPEDVLCEKYCCNSKASALPHALFQLKRSEVRNDIKAACSQCSPLKKGKRFLRIIFYGEQSNEIQKRMERIVVEQSIDLIYTYWCTQATVAALRLKSKFPTLKVITRLHRFDLYQEPTASDWQILRLYIAENCDKLIFVSEDGRQYFINHWGYEEKTLVSYLGSKSRKKIMLNHNDTLVLASCSNLIPIKRVGLILDALQMLPEEQKIEWHHYGDGVLGKGLRTKAQKLGEKHENQQYVFHGKIPNNRIEEEYHKINAQLFISTTISEGLPASMMEAISMGIPVMGTNVNGIPELIEDGKSGFLLSANPTPQQIADCIMAYARASDTEKQRMSDAAYESWQKKFDAEKKAIEFCREIKMLLH